jgi:hypothetical protein
MTADLRRLHDKATRWLVLLLPLALLLALIGYRLPVYSEIPSTTLTLLPEGAERESFEEDSYEGGVRVRIETFKVPVSGALASSSRRWVRVTFLDPVRQPDLMVYWASKSSTYEEPPLGSFLLGVMDPRVPQAFPLPQQAEFLRGYLVIYSTGQHVLITQALLPQPF